MFIFRSTVYNDQEQALARMGVDPFHERYNQKDYDALFAMMAEATHRVQPKEVVVSAMQQTVERWGKEQSSSLAVA